MLLLRTSILQSVSRFLSHTQPIYPLFVPFNFRVPNFGCYFLYNISQISPSKSLNSFMFLFLSSLPKFVYHVTVITVVVSSFSTRGDYRTEDITVKSASKASRRRRRRRKKRENCCSSKYEVTKMSQFCIFLLTLHVKYSQWAGCTYRHCHFAIMNRATKIMPIWQIHLICITHLISVIGYSASCRNHS
jgi:hypothetical protein